MKHPVLILILNICICSCGSNNAHQKETLLQDTILITESGSSKANETADSLPAFKNYIIKVNRSYFFNSPDLKTKTKEYLFKGNLVLAEVKKMTGDFVYAIYTTSQGKQKSGWLLVNDLEQILFTLPKIVNGSE